MKNLYKVLSVVMMTVAASCTNNISEINVNPKSYTKVPGAMLFTAAQRQTVNNMTSANVNVGIFRLTAQQWTETTYTDETRHDLGTRNIPQNFWTAIYRDVLMDLKEAKRLVSLDADTPLRANQLAMIDILAVYNYSVLVNTFGDIPYSAALDADNNVSPSYDDAATITNDLLARLDTDIASLSTAAGGFGSQDIYFAANNAAGITKWIKFANSLKLRIAMTIADSDAAKSKSAAEAAAASGNLILANADNVTLTYLPATPNTNPVWVDLVQSGRQDFVAGKTIVDLMNATNDPRRVQFFTTIGGAYVGGAYGVGNVYANFSKASAKLTATTFPGVLMDAAEVEFYLAEAAARGYTVSGGIADVHYANAITLSITQWGGTGAEATTYLAQPSVAYLTATGTYKQKIGTQKYLALYNRGFESWTEIRRLDFPVMNTVSAALSGYPNRYIYPVSEQNLNTAAFQAAASKVAGGSDKVEAKLFWDKF